MSETLFDAAPQKNTPGSSTEEESAGRAPATGSARTSARTWSTCTCEEDTGDHFAVMPGRLARDCLLAGSPERCCGTCGAPWERVVDRTSMVVREGPGRAGLKDAATGATSRTVGWAPTCGHDDPSGSSVVLDPFSGAGTTGVQALRAGRSYVGVELNAGYAELARNRIRDDAPLMNVPAEEAA